MKYYPLLFEPNLKEVIWGGHKLQRLKGLHQDATPVGESWEISAIPEHPSVVLNGSLKGKSLPEVVAFWREALLGEHVCEATDGNFPLLFKFIDAKDDLSIQVHPDDAMAKRLHNGHGKTEMWYVIDAEPQAYIYSGFARPTRLEDYDNALKKGNLLSLFARYEVKKGDLFFLPAGRPHAIGSGCVIAEIQQSSDITYRIYDYERRDKNGKSRELHTEHAREAIDFSYSPEGYRSPYNISAEGLSPLISSAYFNTNLIETKSIFELNLFERDSFTSWMVLEGIADMQVDDLESITIKKGDSVLIPAACKKVSIRTPNEVFLLDTFVP